jgi:hypothetical protein
MARIATVLGALWTAVRRDAKSIGSFSSNNFFVVGAAFLLLGDPGAFVSVNAIVAVILFFPLSTDPLRKIPAIRLALWPLTKQERWRLRILSPWLNPITWLLAALALWKGVTIGLWAAIAGLFIVALIIPSLPLGRGNGVWRAVPHFPSRVNQLVRKDIRQILSSLDFYCALGWSAIAGITRAMGRLPADARGPLSIVIVLALSTIALNSFGPDGDAGMTRYKLLPVRGWHILLAKDGAFLLIAVLLTVGLSPLAGMSAALTALAIGHYDSVKLRHHETRWRFRTSESFGRSIFQVTLLTVAGAGVGTGVPYYLFGSIGLYAASLWWFGRLLER